MKKFNLLLICLGVLLLCAACQKDDEPQKKVMEDRNISLYMHETGEVEEIDLEEYLCGVVAAEMDVNWPKEALAAQAILARTFTLEKIEAGGVAARGTDASTDIEEFQAYDAGKINDNVREAVAQTEGQVVTYDGKLIKAWFFADGGGMTSASAEEGLSYTKTPTPYIHSVEDPGADLADNENNQWEATFSLEEVNAALTQIGIEPLSELTEASIAQTGESGRAFTLSLNGEEVGAVAFRLAVGSEKMKSTLLEEISASSGELYLKGRGYGHGVGMSQWGARALAEQGKSAQEIIGYFFQDVQIEEIY